MRSIKFGIVSIFGIILLATAALAIAGSGADANRLQCSMVIRQKPAALWPWLYEADKVKQCERGWLKCTPLGRRTCG